MQCLGQHAAAVRQEEERDRVEFQKGASKDSTIRHVRQNPALGQPECQQTHDRQACGDGEAFEVLGLAICVFGNVAGGDVEASQTCETGENEAGEEELVEASA